MANFLYLFWNKQGNWKPPSPEEMERRTKAWMSWMDGLRKEGHLIKAGERLDGTGKVVRGKAKAVTDGPYAEAKDTIGGYLLVEARDLDHAAELAKGCPILESEGMVEVRPIVSM
jgi:hypothetical protein